MDARCRTWIRRTTPLAGLALALSLGCQHVPQRDAALAQMVPPESTIPRELCKVTLPTYIIEPPDVLLIDAVKVVPKKPYRLEALDIVTVIVVGTLPDPLSQINANYQVDGSGEIDLGPTYGSVKVAGLSLEEARGAITDRLTDTLANPEVSIALAQPAIKQLISAEHLVGPDGTVSLGVYGKVRVSGLTINEARKAVEKHLSQFLEEPEVAVDVFAYNSKVYYVITPGAGIADESVVRLPVTGNETVLDAISQLGGLQVFSTNRLWIARPAPDDLGVDQILPIDWQAIVTGASTETNYQILPGDRIFIAEDKLVAFDSFVQRMVAPFDRTLGFLLLGTQSTQASNRFPNGFNF